MLQTIPYTWWTQFTSSATAPSPTLAQPVDGAILAELRAKFPDFIRAHDEGGMAPREFLGYGATQNTLTQFLGGYDRQDTKQRLSNPVWHIHSANPPKIDMPVTFQLQIGRAHV